MKKTTFPLRITALLAVLLCVALSAWSQPINKPAEYGQETTATLMFKAPVLRAVYIAGDVNCSGNVDINDVTALINTILTGQEMPNGDVDGNFDVDINDVTELISMILHGTSPYTAADGLEALNDIYRSMCIYDGIIIPHQSFGINAYTLVAELMGDDMIMGAMGYGWFWRDAGYNQKVLFDRTSGRSYDMWTRLYTWIANANYILQVAQNGMSGTTSEVNYVKGQAYAIRAYSYFILAQTFARTYKGHESDPGVPIFNGTVFNGSTGQPRSTVAQVYAQIDADMAQAVSLLNGLSQQSTSHISYAVARGLQARIYLVEEKWSEAYTAATDAISASGKSIVSVSDFVGLNDVSAGNVMWGKDIPENEAGMYASFISHMSHYNGYGVYSPKQISKWLYNKMSATDERLAWWGPNTTGRGTDAPIQEKFKVVDGTTWEYDYIWMRVEEMYLTAAEAACRQGLNATARNYLNQLMNKRDANYSCSKSGTNLGTLTTDETGSLLEEILIQRRLELWGEDGRIYTIRRLHQGFTRTSENGWPTDLLLQDRSLSDPESYPWVLPIPFSEFSGNQAMDATVDQNPMGDYPDVMATGPQNVSFLQATQTIQTVESSITVAVPVKRAVSTGTYFAVVRFNTSSDMASHVSVPSDEYVVYFADGETQKTINVSFQGMQLGKTYTTTVILSNKDIANSSSSLGATITSTDVVVNCKNGNPAGMNISFEQATMDEVAYNASATYAITITRESTSEPYGIDVVLSDDDGHESLPYNRVAFAAGADRFIIYVTFENMEVGHDYSCLLSLVPATGTGNDPAVGAIGSMRVNVTREALEWTDLGYATFGSDLLGSESMLLQVHSNGTDYRLVNFFGEGYNVTFTIDGDNNVYVPDQPVFEHSQGTVYILGYANADDSAYAGTYDPSQKRVTMQNRYYVPGVGYFGTFTDILDMP